MALQKAVRGQRLIVVKGGQIPTSFLSAQNMATYCPYLTISDTTSAVCDAWRSRTEMGSYTSKFTCSPITNGAFRPLHKNEDRLTRCGRAAFEETNVAPDIRVHGNLLSCALNFDVSAKLHRLVTNFLAACPQSNCCDNRCKNDSALHGLLSYSVQGLPAIKIVASPRGACATARNVRQ